MEFSIVGSGASVLVFHGGHSSCRESLGYQELVANGYRLITPSRPGYGATSAELGGELDHACEAYAELMDELGLASAHVMAVSAGGPTGIRFAARYPERTRSLVLQSAVTRQWPDTDSKAHKVAQIMFNPAVEKYIWSLLRGFGNVLPRVLFKSMASSFSYLPFDEVLRRSGKNDVSLFVEMIKHQRSENGFKLDMLETQKNQDEDLARICCPAMVLHSRHDSTVSIEHARHVKGKIQHAEVCELESWGHLIWLGEEAGYMYDRLFAFLSKQEIAAT
ncbi:alpha/beta fold hydrolase [Paenibacillus sp. NPDC057967]|uniref:alpha/beta fold hydrolase n=1 Tax=Paenibacillus sp. NPDC057967 TaxID=3346293 RepID=UPI0036DB4BB3